MTYFPYRKTLSGWILVAVLNTGTLWAEETPLASTAEESVPSEQQVAADAPAGDEAALDAEADPAAEPTAADPDARLMTSVADVEMSYWDVAGKLGLALAFVVLLAWGAVLLLRKSAVGQQFGGVGKTIRIAERTYLSPKKAIYLVDIGGRTLALGVTEENITPLSEWQPGELELAAGPEPGGLFAAQFKNLLKQGNQEGQSA